MDWIGLEFKGEILSRRLLLSTEMWCVKLAEFTIEIIVNKQNCWLVQGSVQTGLSSHNKTAEIQTISIVVTVLISCKIRDLPVRGC